MADKDFALALKSIVGCYNETDKIKITLREFERLRDIERVERIERKLYEYERKTILNNKKYDILVKLLLIISIIGLISVALNIISWL